MIKTTEKESAAENAGNGGSGEPAEREYNGHPILTLNPQSRYPFSFGPAKARMILHHLPAIREFAAKYQDDK